MAVSKYQQKMGKPSKGTQPKGKGAVGSANSQYLKSMPSGHKQKMADLEDKGKC